VYLAFWCTLAWRTVQRGTLGPDVDRRGPQVLTVVSLVDCAAALAAMPLLGLASARRIPLLTIAAVFGATTVSAGALAALSDRVGGDAVLATRTLVAAAGAAAFAIARLAAAACRDIYDAAGLAYGAVVLAAGGVVFAAPLLARVPESGALIPALLLVNPFVATASATAFDLLRTDVLYRATPIAQRFFEYPAWHTAAAAYAAGAAACALATMFLTRDREARCV
jgi:hypothetical protein